MQAPDLGQKPNDVVFHAETTVLLRAAAKNGDTLAGKNLDVSVSRPLCWDCLLVLPYVGLELGNPTVTFIDNTGARRTMRDGRWISRTMANGKYGYFASRDMTGWPTPDELESYFLAPPGKRWFFETGNDTAGFAAEGVDGTAHLDANTDRIDVNLSLWGVPDLGVLLIWSKWGGPHTQIFTSKGT